MNANEIREHLLARAPWVDREQTVDTIKAGDPARPVHGVGVGWVASIGNLRAAHKLGCELFITHEPTFWQHAAPEARRDFAPAAAKQRFLEETGMVVLRVHDIWDRWPEVGIRDAWARGLGLDDRVAGPESRLWGVYAIPETTLAAFAQHVAQRIAVLGEDGVRAMGDPEMRVSRPALGVGCIGPDSDAIDAGADVMVVCYDGASYWQTRQRFAELELGVIAVEHGTSELWGIEGLAAYLRETFPPLEVHYLALHPRPWTVMVR